MKISQIERVQLVEGLDRNNSRSYRLWESAGHQLLKEYQIDPKLIPQLFQEIEAGLLADPTGANRTMLGKGKDSAVAVNKAWEDLKSQIQNSGPIQGFDKKVNDVLSKIGMGSKDPELGGKVSGWVQGYRDFAKDHPIIQGAIYASLIAVLGLSGAGIGGAAALGLLKMADKLIQGERASSAAYSGAKTGAMAYAASHLLHGQKPETSQQFPTNPDIGQNLPTDAVTPPGVTDYEIKPGDTLSDIAKKMKVSVDDLMKANDGATHYMSNHDPDLDKFTNVDAMGGQTGPQDFDVTPYTNPHITNPDVLTPGQHINIPSETGHSIYQAGEHGPTGLAQNTTDRIGTGEFTDSAISRAQQAKWDDLAKAATDTGAEAAKGAAGNAHQAIANRAASAADAASSATDAADTVTGAVGDTTSNAADATQAAGDTTSNAAGDTTSNAAQSAKAPDYDGPPDMSDPKDVYNKELASAQRAQIRAGIDPNTPEAQQVAQASARLSMKDAIRHLEYLKSLPPGAKPWSPPDGMAYESKQQYIDPQSTVRHWALKESLGRPRGGIRLTEAGVQQLFRLVTSRSLNEGIMDTLKGAASKVGDKLKQTGKNLTNKVTADKLNSAWTKAGSSTDSEAITKMMLDMGVPQPVIDAAFTKLGIKDPGAATGATPAGGADAAKAGTDATAAAGGDAAKAGAPDAAASQFVKDLVAGYMALTPADKAEIMKEIDSAIAMNDNPNVVKATTESKRYKKKAVR